MAEKYNYVKGCAKPKEGMPTLLLVAHTSGKNRFGGEHSFVDLLQGASKLNLNLYACLPDTVIPLDYAKRVAGFVSGMIIFKYAKWYSNNPPDQQAISIFMEIINKYKVDLVHVNTIINREPLIATRKCRVKSAVHIRELIDRDPDLANFIGMSPEQIISHVIKSADFIIANSKTTACTYPKPGKTFVLPNTVDLQAFDINNEIKDEIRIAMVSSNTPKKGLQDFVTLANECDRRNIEARFLLVGPCNEHVEELFGDKVFGPVPGNFHYGGYYSNPVQAIGMGNVIVNFSSFAESFGRTVLEAMASRRPVIAYDWGALPELVRDGRTGYLVPYKDIHAAVPIIKDLSENHELIRDVGEQARQVAVTGYNQELFTSELGRIYSAILETDITLHSGDGLVVSAGETTCGSKIATKERPGISIVILNLNGAHYLDRLLETFSWNNTYQPVELIIVDHASTDRTDSVVEKWSERLPIRYLKRNRNYTFSASNNYGVENAAYPDLLFLNNDIVYTTDMLPLAAAQLQDSSIGAVGVRLDDDCANLAPGELPAVQHVGIKFAWDEQWQFDRPYQLRLRTPVEAENVKSGLYPAVTGAFMLCRKDDFLAVGGFCEEYDYGYEDVDFCLQLWFQLGKRSLCINEFSLQHSEKASRKIVPTAVRARRESKNIKVFKRKTAEFDLGSGSWLTKDPVERPIPETVTIVVPVYNALEETMACLESLALHLDGADRVIVIDDCSTDSSVWPSLDKFGEAHSLFYCMRNDKNMGYTATVNKGIQMAKGDAVILNSDTMVTANWLAKLREAALSRENVATVTPLSNAAGAFSLPENNVNNPIPEGMTVDQVARLVEDESYRIRPAAPTGNGFCMYIRRKAIDALGLFDETGFPRGYGEENDFCQRAIRAGFVNLIDDATFIYHKRSASFGKSKNDILPASASLIEQRWPNYEKEVNEWLNDDPLTPFRKYLKNVLVGFRKLQLQHLSYGEKTMKILFVHHAGGGGVPLTNRDLLKYVSRHHRCYLLITGLTGWKLCEWFGGQENIIGEFEFKHRWRVDKPLEGERLTVLRDICNQISPDLVHVRHMIANHPDMIQVFKSFHLPVVISFHDFYTLCPTIHLVDKNLKYCSGLCAQTGGQCRADPYWFEGIPPLDMHFVRRWRETAASALALGDAFVMTSPTTREVMQEHYPFLEGPRIHIIEHGRDMQFYPWVSTPPVPGDPVQLLLFGSLGRNKGVKLIRDILEMSGRCEVEYHVHILGTADLRFDPLAYENCTYHGGYGREELPRLLAKLRPSLALIPSIWPETFCHTLTEAWAAGIPVLGSNLGAVGERINRLGGGWTLEPRSAAVWIDKIAEIAESPFEYESKRDQIRNIIFKSAADMAGEYIDLYHGVMGQAYSDSSR